jgi:malonate-semialdehyde dehydrogenase (acetylating)/methylmalonate-semialdehyde dehydrogenase
MMDSSEVLLNYIDGEWRKSTSHEILEVINPATGKILAKVPLSPAVEVDQAAKAATEAFSHWSRTPPTQRIQYLFKLKDLLDALSKM